MEYLSYLVATGISTGALYALVALGIVVIYKATQVVNFAHGEMFMLGGFFAFTFHVAGPTSPPSPSPSPSPSRSGSRSTGSRSGPSCSARPSSASSS